MRKVALLAFLAVSITAPAAAFDNSSCTAFMTGTWSWDQGGGGTVRVLVLNADGSLVMVQGDDVRTGSKWKAEPGPEANQCSVYASIGTSGDKWDDANVMTVVDDNTLDSEKGGRLTRK